MLYDAQEKSISNITEKKCSMKVNNLLHITNSDSIKQLKDNTRDLEESLTSRGKVEYIKKSVGSYTK